ncbi:MAG: SRPBCC family protein [Myxococcota bacterium]
MRWPLSWPAAGHVAEATRTVAAPPAAVWAAVVDYDAHPRWRSGLRAAVRRGDRVEETDARGDVLAVVIEAEEPERRLVTRVVDQTAFSGTWTLTLAPEGDGTRVTIVERGEIHSLVFRLLAPLFHDPQATARTWLDDLARHLE